MKRRITFEQLVALVDDDRELVTALVSELIIERTDEGFCAEDVERALASRTLVRELDVNWAGVDVILRLREQLARARRRIEELECGLDK